MTTSHTKQCQICGISCTWQDKQYWDFQEIRSCYSVGYKDICNKCGQKANSYVNYYGIKTPEDVLSLELFLLSGVLINNEYSALMNAGYY